MCLFVTLKRVWISISYLSGNNLLIITVICLFVFFFFETRGFSDVFFFFFLFGTFISNMYFTDLFYEY